jgi:hypothetical protein
VLFEINRKPIINDALGRRLILHYKIHFHNSLGLLEWRYLAKYIIKTRVIRNTGIVLLSDSSFSDEGGGVKLQWIEDRQSNHILWTAQLIYARNAELPIGITENIYGNLLALSRKYQDFLQVEDAPCVIRRDPNSRKKGKHARQVSDLNNTAFSKRPKIMQSAIDQSLQGNTQSIKQLLANLLCEYFGSKRAKFRSSY